MAITDNTDTSRILVAGCGKLGTAIARSLSGRQPGFTACAGTRRHYRKKSQELPLI